MKSQTPGNCWTIITCVVSTKAMSWKILIVKYHRSWVLLIDLRAIMKNSLKLRRVLKKKLEAFLQMVKYSCNALFLTSEIEALRRNPEKYNHLLVMIWPNH
jgi:hypothetical protein